MLSLGGRFIPLRGVGKAAFLRAIDVGRAAARALGAAWAERGLLADSDDVFMFTAAELGAAEPPSRVRELAAERRATHDKYLGLDIPPVFEGEPTPFALATGEGPRERSSDPITGLPVSPGTIEGVARVVEDPAADAIEPGEILVCRTTDPSWASMMMLASALVIDIGGAISHGAIIARELGIPCVIGTRDGTRRIRTGDALRVDGQTGEVTLREPVPG